MADPITPVSGSGGEGTSQHESTLPMPPEPGTARHTSTRHRSIADLGLRGIGGAEDLARQLDDWQPCLIAEAPARYAMHGLIGRGGQGLVFEVEDHDTGRRVALKTLRSDREQQRHAERFIHEAQVIAQLEHPGIVPIHDLGALPDGTLFYTMKRIGGSSLRDVLAQRGDHRERRFELLQIFLKLCDTMAFAHARGVVHRDLKPDNVMVGDFGEVLVVDWGLSKVLPGSQVRTLRSGPDTTPRDESESASSTVTHAGHALGTPGYMSPEQATACHHAVDQRSDVYSLGVILYELLAGRSPYRVSGGPAVMEACARGDWDPIRTVAGDVPRPLAAVVDRAMGHLQERRYFTAGELAADIRRHLAGHAVLAYREGRLEQCLRFARRHRTPLVSMSAVAALALLVFAGWTGWNAHQRSERIADLRAEAATALAEGRLDRAQAAYERILELDAADLAAREDRVRTAARLKARQEREAAAMAAAQARESAERLRAEAAELARSGAVADLEEASSRLAQAAQLLSADDRELRAALRGERDALRERLSDHRLRARRARADAHLASARAHADAGRWSHARGELRLAEELVPADTAIRELEARIARGEAAAERARLAGLAEAELARAGELRAEQRFDEALAAVRASLRIAPLPEATALLETLSTERARQRAADEQARRQARAEEALAEARPLVDRIDELAATIAASDEGGGDRVARRLELVDQAFALLHRAHHLAPDWDPARLALVEFYRDRVIEAEAAGRSIEASSAAAQGLLYDHEQRYPLLFAGRAAVHSAGGELRLHPLGGGEAIVLAAGATVEVPAGRYEITTTEGLRYARLLRRGQRGELPAPRLPELPAGMLAVVGGPIYGEDGREQGTVEGFLMARCELTCGEWLAFLNDPETQRELQRQETGPLRLEPRASWDAERGLWARERDVFGNLGRFRLQLADGAAVDPDSPVMGISRRDVEAYLAWRRARDGLAWRLPTAGEWRLAAQGGDGRRFPWGQRAALQDCYSLATAADRGYRLRPVASFPVDGSVAGINDLAGSVSELTSSSLPGRGGVAVVCGGSHASGDPRLFGSYAQRGVDERWTATAIGLRLALSWDAARPEPHVDDPD